MIQIDLPMPEACDVCPLNYDFCWCQGLNKEEWEKYGDDWNEKVCERKDRPEYCPLKEIIMCKDCKHRPDENYEFPEGSKCPCHCSGDEYYSWIPDDDWFCADGERMDSP